MSRQRNPLSYLPRRLQIVAVLSLFLLFCLLLLRNQSPDGLNPYLDRVPYSPTLQDRVHHVVEGAQHVVDYLPNPLAPPAHAPPPDQANSSSGETRWYSDWKWKNPFSSSVTLDHDRAVLPPLTFRPPVYAYYDASQRRKDEKSRKAEQELLQIWRRAWWAKGFRPVVLSKSEAVNNPLYRRVQHFEMERSLENELMRWLAWGNMGTGILSNFLALPMAAHHDAFLSFLRRGEYPVLTRYEGLANGIFVGSKEHIEAALKAAIASPALKRVKFIDEALPEDTIHVDRTPTAIAYYSERVIRDKYKLIGEKFDDLQTVADGLAMLPALINSHLQISWHNLFPKGVAILKPISKHTTAVIEPALDIATNLTTCLYSPIPSSCPPNQPRCKTCASNSLKISTMRTLRNESDQFIIATMPHPYTVQSLVNTVGSMDLRFIRRETERDIWIQAATNGLVGTGVSSFARIPTIKDAVASHYSSVRSLWLIAEQPLPRKRQSDLEELEWIFGFCLPRHSLSSNMGGTAVSGVAQRPKPDFGLGSKPTEADLRKEEELFQQAKLLLQSSSNGKREAVKTKEQIEAWNMADTEAWKFIRAYNARRILERQQWEHEEASFLGKGTLDRWIDKIT